MQPMAFLFRPHFHSEVGWIVAVLVLVFVVILALKSKQ